MILPICVYGHPVLRRKAQDVDLKAEDLLQLIADMFETMYHSNGVGIAAPQVGKSLRIFVIDSEPFKELYPEEEPRKQAFINPTILQRYGEEVPFSEGCLSLPGINEEVLRPSTIEIEYWDEKLNHHKETISGGVARIIQHEYDHLEGTVFTDHLTSLKKMILKRKLSDIASGKTKPSYKIKNH
ncbi:MAG: peptide deformylase [Bacteroidales bacterium]|jgi:peptide deformylase|nr:peptide deformylase [Bacteroidales bacterium]